MSTEQNKQIIKEINKEITEAELTELKTQVRAYKQSQLEQDEQLKREIAEREEKRRIIKLNLANLDKGNFEAIEERIQKSKMARQVDPIRQVEKIIEIWHEHFPRQYWHPWRTGTYLGMTQNSISGTNPLVDNMLSGFTFANGDKTFTF
jgi:hypothetical protein